MGADASVEATLLADCYYNTHVQLSIEHTHLHAENGEKEWKLNDRQ